jgi:hypothetical protein
MENVLSMIRGMSAYNTNPYLVDAFNHPFYVDDAKDDGTKPTYEQTAIEDTTTISVNKTIEQSEDTIWDSSTDDESHDEDSDMDAADMDASDMCDEWPE